MTPAHSNDPGASSVLPSGRSLASVRHDLRTPLNQIIGYGELLEEDVIAANQNALLPDLQKIQTAAKNLLHLIESHLAETNHAGHSQQLEPIRPNSAPIDFPLSSNEPSVDVIDPVKLLQGKVLVVDDHQENREVLTRRLHRRGLQVATATNGHHALQVMAAEPFDVVLLDVMMPELDGFQTLLRIKEDPALRHTPVIMISALDELDSVVRCIQAGAEDYLPKPFNPTLLNARLSACLEKKALRDAEQGYLQRIEATQKRLQSELQDAADYIRSLFPPPQTEKCGISTDWIADPCSELGGDAFGYHWLDDDHYAIYLLDVSGHGVRPCLLAATVLNLLRSAHSAGNDMRNPSTVLSILNSMFPMERQNDMFFTMWYGVYHTKNRTLTYANGGHPDALLLQSDNPSLPVCQRLASTGIAVGVMEDERFESVTVSVPENADLLIFSDGCFELSTRNEKMLSLERVASFFESSPPDQRTPAAWLNWIRQARDEDGFDDDFTMLKVRFARPAE